MIESSRSRGVCGRWQELEWSFRLFKEMREQGTVPNGVTCSALMDACLKADDIDLAFAVLEHMLDMGIEPTEVREEARVGVGLDRCGFRFQREACFSRGRFFIRRMPD